MKLIILDRDGVINHHRSHGVKSADEWQPVEGSLDAIACLTQAGYTLAVATNQAGIGKNEFSVQELTEIHNKMHKLVQQAGGYIDGIWFCPHTDAAGCRCRKPAPGMLSDILTRFNTRARDVYLVGDSLRDLQAVTAVGGKPVLVLSGKGKVTLSRHKQALPEGTQIFDNLAAFARHLLQEPDTKAEHAADT